MRKIVLASCLLILIQWSWAQVSLTGVLADSLGTVITQESTVALLTKKDLLKVAQGKVSQGHFTVEFTPRAHVEYVLYVFALGYRDCYLDVTDRQGDLGKVRLAPLSVALREVIVKPGRLQHDIVNGNDVFKVSGTELAQEHSVSTMLRRLPGVMVDDKNSVTVVGAGTPLFTINGEKPRPGEWEAITPDQIDKVTINTMPSVKYAAKVGSVLDIRLKKRLKDFLSVYIQNETTVNSKYISEKPTFHVNMGGKKFSNYIGYNHQYAHNEELDKYTMETICLPDGMEYNQEHIWKDGLNLDWSHTLNISPKYQINDKSFIDVQYALSYLKNREVNEESWLRRTGRQQEEMTFEQSELDGHSRNHSYSHDLATRYVYEVSEMEKLAVNAGYSKNRVKNGERFREYFEGQSEVTVSDQRANSETFIASADYQTVLKDKFVLETGLQYCYITSDNRSLYENASTKNSLVETKERTAAGYLGLGQTLGKFYYSVGLRCEYQSRTSVYYGWDRTDKEHSFYLIPKVGLNYRPSKAWSVNLSYNYSRYNPSAVDLDPTVYYTSKYMYKTGNPDLKPAEAHQSRFKITHLPTNIALTVNYSYVNSILSVFLNDETNPQVIKSTLENRKNSNVQASLSYYKNWEKYTFSINGIYSQSFSKALYLDKEIDYSTPQFQLGLMNYLTLPKGFSLSCGFGYSSKSVFFPQEVKWRMNGNVGAQYRYKNLTVAVNAFVSSRYVSSRRYGYMLQDSKLNNEHERFVFSINYRINQYKQWFQKNQVNSEAVKRSISSY